MRRIVKNLVGCLCVALSLASCCFAKEWRGIVPLHTTRAEIIKLIGEPRHTWEGGWYFYIPDAKVSIEWIDPTCEREYPIPTEQQNARPDDLVLNIYVYPTKPISSKELNMPKDGYMTLGCHPNDWCTLWNSEAGFGFTAAKEGIDRHWYSPTADEYRNWTAGHKSCKRSAKNAT